MCEKMIKKRKMKRRRTVTILILGIFTITTMLNFALARDKDTVSVIVKSGDSVWTIAGEYNYNNKDLRKLVHEIIEKNNLGDGTIYAGQELIIPIN